MENTNKKNNKTSFVSKENVINIVVILIACTGIIFFSIYPIPSLALSGAIVAIICALAGVWITVAVTQQ